MYSWKPSEERFNDKTPPSSYRNKDDLELGGDELSLSTPSWLDREMAHRKPQDGFNHWCGEHANRNVVGRGNGAVASGYSGVSKPEPKVYNCGGGTRRRTAAGAQTQHFDMMEYKRYLKDGGNGGRKRGGGVLDKVQKFFLHHPKRVAYALAAFWGFIVLVGMATHRNQHKKENRTRFPWVKDRPIFTTKIQEITVPMPGHATKEHRGAVANPPLKRNLAKKLKQAIGGTTVRGRAKHNFDLEAIDLKAGRPISVPRHDEENHPKPKQVHSTTEYQHGEHGDYLPHQLQDSLANIWDKVEHATPLFWHIPKSGGTTVADIMTHCLNLVSASKIGATEGHGDEPILQVNTYQDQGRYVNADTATLEGLDRAKKLGLVSSGLTDVVVTHRFREGAALFDPSRRARTFAMFRHPVRREVSMFYYLQQATWELTYDPSLTNMTLEEYATSSKAEENWVTRSLTKEYEKKVTDQHVDLAKELLRRKILVGLLERFDESMKRFELYFGWWDKVVKRDPERTINCQQRKFQANHNHLNHPDPDEESPAYQLLAKRNWADMELYEYAVQMFQDQAVLVDGTASLMHVE